MNAALYAMFGSMLNWMLYNIEIACTSDVLSARDTAIEEVNWVLMIIMRLEGLSSDLLEVLIQ